jgi:hypothetical protein
MAKRTFTATFGNQVFTRATERVYTHAVSCKPNLEKALADAKLITKQDRKDHAYYCDAVRRNDFQYLNQAVVEKYAAMTLDQYLQHLVESATKAVRDAEAEGYYSSFCRPTFHGSLALAQKEAQKDRNYGRLEVTIVEVQ